MLYSERPVQKEHPEIGAFLLECSNIPPACTAMHPATGLPAFDIITTTNWVESGVNRPNGCDSCVYLNSRWASSPLGREGKHGD
jgi:hypothetical protein